MFGSKRDPQERIDQMLATMEEMPVRLYLSAAIGSLALSALLFIAGKRTAALFIGQWPPTLILLSLFYRLLRPSEEDTSRGLKRTLSRAKSASR